MCKSGAIIDVVSQWGGTARLPNPPITGEYVTLLFDPAPITFLRLFITQNNNCDVRAYESVIVRVLVTAEFSAEELPVTFRAFLLFLQWLWCFPITDDVPRTRPFAGLLTCAWASGSGLDPPLPYLITVFLCRADTWYTWYPSCGWWPMTAGSA